MPWVLFAILAYVAYRSIVDGEEREPEVGPMLKPGEKVSSDAAKKWVKLVAPLSPPLRKTTPHGAYGARRPTDPKKPFDHNHQGVDLAGKAGEEIYAVADGKIVNANAGKGELVRVLALPDGRAVVYADLGDAKVNPGDDVRAGDVIGHVRKNGFVHVAIRVSRYGSYMDPAGVLPFDAPKKNIA